MQKDLTREIASSRDGRDITRGYTGPLLVSGDTVLQTRGGGNLEIYERVLSDPKCGSAFGDRRRAVVSKEWQVDAGGDRRVDKQAAEFLREQLQAVGWDRLTDRMLHAVWYGYAVAEIMYAVRDGAVVWDAIKVRNRRRFRFSPDGSLRLLTLQRMLDGEELPEEKFWQISTGADHDDEPYGLGLAHYCYWPVLFKRNGMKFWLSFLEKFAAPTAIGRYDPNTSNTDQQRLLAALQAVQSDAAVIMPKGMEVDLLEAARSGTADYRALQEMMDAIIAQVIVGQTASAQGTPGKLGNDALQGEVRDDLVKADADLICESFNQGPVQWLIRRNFPSAEMPRVYRICEPPEDLESRAKRDVDVRALGYKPTQQYIDDTYGPGWLPDAPPPPDAPAVPPAPGAALDMAAPGDDPTYMDAMVEQLAQQAGPLTDEWIEQIRTQVQQAQSWDDLLGRLSVQLQDLPLDALGTAVAGASAAAERAGRVDGERGR